MKTYNRRGGFTHSDTPYRSGLEDKLAAQLKTAGVKATYEQHRIKYVVPEKWHTYTPDFILPNNIIIEGKGVFDSDDRKKHLLIKKQYPNLEIRFVFSNPNQKLYKGSKTTYGDWCEKYDFEYAKQYIPAEWISDTSIYSRVGLIEK